MDIDIRASRLEREQRQRREAVKRRLDQERRSQERYQQQQRELEAIKAVRTLEREAQEERRRLEEEAELTRTSGVRFTRELHPYPIDSDEDKVILPESSLLELTNLNAFQHGALTFELTCSASAVVTHCGVREFSAPEGSIGVPRRVVNTLTGNSRYDSSSESIGAVKIKFVLLPKVTFARLQPIEASFAGVTMIKACLQENLRRHATLTVGDILSIWFRGRSYRLRVHELRPESYGSLIDTDVEVELLVSEEYEQKIQKPVDAATPKSLESETGVENDADTVLDEEPTGSGDHVIECKIKTAEGVTKTRKFLKQSDFKELFIFAYSVCGGRAVVKSLSCLQLNTRFPKRVFSFHEACDGRTFADFGFSPQEVFLVTLCK